MSMATTGDRVRDNTAPGVQEKIDRRIAENVRYYAAQPRRVMERRLRRLENEWDIERVLEANASSLALLGVVLGATIGRRWLFLSAGVLGFLLTHAIQGWCPPVPALRRMGVRTQKEIEREKYALKVLRGDFDHVIGRSSRHGWSEADAVQDAVEK